MYEGVREDRHDKVVQMEVQAKPERSLSAAVHREHWQPLLTDRM